MPALQPAADGLLGYPEEDGGLGYATGVHGTTRMAQPWTTGDVAVPKPAPQQRACFGLVMRY